MQQHALASRAYVKRAFRTNNERSNNNNTYNSKCHTPHHTQKNRSNPSTESLTPSAVLALAAASAAAVACTTHGFDAYHAVLRQQQQQPTTHNERTAHSSAPSAAAAGFRRERPSTETRDHDDDSMTHNRGDILLYIMFDVYTIRRELVHSFGQRGAAVQYLRGVVVVVVRRGCGLWSRGCAILCGAGCVRLGNQRALVCVVAWHD